MRVKRDFVHHLLRNGPLLACLVLLLGSHAVGAETRQVGSISLRRCQIGAAYCAELPRPLDPTGAIAGQISIHFEFYPHSAHGSAAGTLVATEGGPGSPATLSREDYLALFAPLLASHDLVLMDNRGTGQSGALDCPGLQSAKQWTIELIGACGALLGERADLYSTAYAADDLAAILEALKIRRVDLYGDSYGTYFEQVFALRHPERLRSLVLDGAFPLDSPDYGWYPTYGPAVRDKYNIACARSAPCASRPGSGIDHLQPLLQTLRAQPFADHGPDGEGNDTAFTADASTLAIVMYGNAPALATLRDLDAAARAFMTGDRVPLLRLMAETTRAVDSRDPSHGADHWSAGLAAAVTCQDYPQIFDMRLAPAARMAARDRAIADRKRAFPDTYAPFTIDEFRGMPLDYSFIDQCVQWPVSPPTHPAGLVVARDARYPDIPALIISGELDDLTTMANGAAVAAAFRHGTQVRIANSFHVNALPRARSECAADLVRRFIQTLNLSDIACAAAVPPVRLVEQFALRAATLPPAKALAGNQADEDQLRWVSAALMTVGDALVRADASATGHGVGLRGGSFDAQSSASGLRLQLQQVRWTQDVAASGRVEQSAGRRPWVRATLDLATPDGSTGKLYIQWNEAAASPSAEIRGRLSGVAVAASAPAP
jgi:pimeloyl-ACP methyl ester carboxylesterase